MTFRKIVAKLLASNLSDEDLKEMLKALFCEPRQSFSINSPFNARGDWVVPMSPKRDTSIQFGDH